VRHPAADMESWRARVPRSEAVVIPGDGYHAAATCPDMCANATLAFVNKHSAPAT
jgi:3-oxoadipate enol-lactonase